MNGFARDLNYPPLVTASGAAMLILLPTASAWASSTASLSLMAWKAANALAFGTNVLAVSIPGRLDFEFGKDTADDNGTTGTSLLDIDKNENVTQSSSSSSSSSHAKLRARTLIFPAGWAFAIWPVIYTGEIIFTGAQLFANETSALASILPQMAAPFVIANLEQSLWCAAFRSKYNGGWTKYASVFLLFGTAFSLFHVHSVACTSDNGVSGFLWAPMSLHFGWTTAATLLNFNGALASDASISDTAVVTAGHVSVVAAVAVGVGLTCIRSAPLYGLTIAWALAACAEGVRSRLTSTTNSGTIKRGAKVQRWLCWIGSATCAIASISTMM